jgi:phospholipid transport system transporter-binding protein
MTTRKPKTPVRKRSRRPAQRPAQRRAAAASGKAPRARRGAAGISLGAECTLAEADSLKRALLRLLEEPRSVAVRIGALQRVDTAGLQLLAAFVRDRRAAGRRVEWHGRAPALDAAATLLGLRDMLELPAGNGR